MNPVLLVSRAVARRRWRAWLGLGLVLGVFAGATMALAQGALQTNSAYPRFVRANHAADVVVAGKSSFGLIGSVDLDQVEAIPGVVPDQSARAFAPFPFTGNVVGRSQLLGALDLLPVASVDGRLGNTIEKWKILDGRAADPARPNEGTGSFELMRRLHLHVGDSIRFHFYNAKTWGNTALALLHRWPDFLAAIKRDTNAYVPDPADGETVDIKIVGVEAAPLEFPPPVPAVAPLLHLTPAFNAKYASKVVGSPASFIRLAHPDQLRAFQLDVEKIAGGKPVSFISTLQNQRAKVQRSIRAEALVLAVLAGLVAFAGAIALTQAIWRQTYAESGDDDTLRALGMGHVALAALSLLRLGMIAGVAVLVACVGAWLATPTVLLSLARTADLDTGFPAHIGLFLIGGAAIIGFTLLVGAVAAWFASRRRRVAQPPGARSRRWSADSLGRAFIPVSAALGARLAIQRTRRSAPAWTAIVGTAFCIAMLTFASTFTQHLHRNLSEKDRYGWNWDMQIGVPALPDLADAVVPGLRALPGVTDLSTAAITQVDMKQTRVDVLAVQTVVGHAEPTILAGRAPSGPDEAVMGAQTMRALFNGHSGLGRIIAARIGDKKKTYRIVGQAVFPEFGDSGHLGTGVGMTVEGLRQLSPSVPRSELFLKFRSTPGARAERARVSEVLNPLPTTKDARPEDLVNLARGDGLLLVLGALLALLALAMLAHTVVTAVRTSSLTYATLRGLGYSRRQSHLTVMWHALTLAGLAAVVGVPLGLLTGRWIWRVFATHLGMEADAFIPGRSVILALGVAVVVGLLAAAPPSWLVTRRRVAEVLRVHD
ncbi:MAG TPA: ABC transporter permease [Acidimicrobiia bacterium]|nr:ABC transporter permease [Acidimicrobiia bacterium]